MEIIESKGKEIYKWKLGASTFLVDIRSGAKLLAWDISIAGESRSVIYCDELSEFSGNPILFPFAGTCSLDGEKFKWKSPKGDILDMPQHGFAKDSKFELVFADENGFTAKLIQESTHRAYYPYDYDFFVIYKFSMFSFSVELKLENKGDCDIPWCCGNHIYFSVPWHKGRTKADYICNINAKSAHLYKDCKLQKVTPLKSFDLADESQINVLHSNLRSKEITFGSKNGEENISININSSQLDKNTCIVTWSPSTDAPFYCIEPWQGLANASEHGKGLHTLKASERESFIIEVSL